MKEFGTNTDTQTESNLKRNESAKSESGLSADTRSVDLKRRANKFIKNRFNFKVFLIYQCFYVYTF